ncbi:hypothetical protein [Motiliproteus sp. MSK22-1]|uniref:hypothetical protein n=1 Tax=Motiliproteus sp. MSK22-1 TaxID=1897630 RepID=UPI000975C042|nr:hypothetical protein [Motiliproteus sp. MSK22-1]OMH31676.1 hypothetical protein BGP75_16250 [Motiliproteus sp. MSK22-1]
MIKKIWMAITLSLLWVGTVSAMSTEAEYVDYLLNKVSSQNEKTKLVALKRLQWSGISSPALYDVIEQRLVELLSPEEELSPRQKKLATYYVRALGYSGNEKYRDYITQLTHISEPWEVKKHARKALTDLPNYGIWHNAIEQSQTSTEGLRIDEAIYLKMLNNRDHFVQRMAARALFHERRSTSQLLEKSAELIHESYKKPLDAQEQDTVAWLCKVIGQNGNGSYQTLLTEVAAETPHSKIAKYARKYI